MYREQDGQLDGRSCTSRTDRIYSLNKMAAVKEVDVVFGATHKPASWGRGIIDDIKQTLGTHWVAEMSNLNVRTFAVSLFIFFACIAPAITFGAMYAKFTNDFIGPVEMITATAWCGIVYALIGGQVR